MSVVRMSSSKKCIDIKLWKDSLNSDDQQFYQYQPDEQ
jgi:hypothetical protein